MLFSAAAGAILGAGIVSKLSERKIRLTMGVALLVTAGFMLAGKMNWIEGGGTEIGLYNIIKEGAYNRKAAVAMAIPGMVAVLIAALIVKSLPLDTLRWLVIIVIVYTSVIMLRAAYLK